MLLTLSRASLSGWPAICTKFSVITNAGVVSTSVVFCGTIANDALTPVIASGDVAAVVVVDVISGGGVDVIASGDVAIGDNVAVTFESIGDDKGLDVSVRLRSFPLPNGPIGRTRYCFTPTTCN